MPGRPKGRSRPGSRASSRPGSRPGSMALSLSASVSDLGSQLITRITGFPDPDSTTAAAAGRNLSEDSETNFQLCHDFFTSNMLYHSFLDPREKLIQEKFLGLQSKWIIQAKPRKAERMEALLDSFNNAPVFKQDVHEQHDIRLRLLSLLIHLSNADSEGRADYEGQIAVADLADNEVAAQQACATVKADEIRQLLREGEQPYRYSEQDSDLSEWSDSGESQESTGEDDSSRMMDNTRLKSVLANLPGVQPPIKVPPVGRNVSHHPNSSHAWLTANTLPQYWFKERDGKTNAFPVEVAPGASRNLVASADAYFAQEAGLPVTEKTVLSEYQVLREIVLSFLSPPSALDKMPLFSYDRDQRRFRPNKDVCVPSLLPQSLQSYMADVCAALTAKRDLDTFIDFVLDQDSHQAMTLEAYAEALADVLRMLASHLTSLESRVTARSETFTMIDFANETSGWFSILGKLASFHKRAVIPLGSVDMTDYNWQASVVVLASLNRAVDTEVSADMYAIYVDLFLKSLAPYFNIASLWVSHGRLQDVRNEFVHCVDDSYHQSCEEQLKSTSSEDLSLPENFWCNGFITHSYEDLLERVHRLPVPKIFQVFFPRVLNCGKSIEVLSILQKQGRLNSLPLTLGAEVTEIHTEFINNLKARLTLSEGGERPEARMRSEGPMDDVRVSDIVADVEDIDPCLVEAFNHVLSVAHKKTSQPAQSNSDYILSGYVMDPMHPVGSYFESCLVPIISDHVDFASTQLLDLFVKTLHLERHLTAIRRTYLMEAGDLMANFCERLFDQACPGGSNHTIDSAGLTMAFHDCFSSSDTDDIILDRFRVYVQVTNSKDFDLSSVSLHYDAEWPLSIVLNSKALGVYNSVFSFLLRIKRALWCLQRITAKQLSEAADNCRRFVAELERDNEMFLLSSTGISRVDKFQSAEMFGAERECHQSTKIHRVLLLRCWLLHFTHSIQSYVMTRVLHARTREFKSSFDRHEVSEGLDGIIDCHEGYVTALMDRCFLNPKEKVLKNTVGRVLDLSVKLHALCTNFCSAFNSDVGDQEDISQEEEIEIKKMKCAALKSAGDLIMDDTSLDKMEDSYWKCHAFLATTLKSITQNRNVPHLESLASDFNQTQPQSRSTIYL